MIKYIIKRLLLMVMIVLIIFIICFTLIRLLPLPSLELFPDNQRGAILARREALGIGRPIIEQIFIFLGMVFNGNWGYGENMEFGRSVVDVFMEKLPATMSVNLWSILLSIPVGIGLGILAALKKNTWIDHTISTLVMVVISVPQFVYAFLVQYALCFKLQWFPMLMNAGTDYFNLDMIRSMMPAILSLSFGTIAGFTRVTRAELTEVLTSEFMLLARTKGLTKGQAVTRHGLKNCMIVILPAIFGEFISIMSGSLIIERVFSVPGVGRLYLTSITTLDYNFFMLLTVFYTVIGLAAGIVIDVSYGFIDPRIRMGSKK